MMLLRSPFGGLLALAGLLVSCENSGGDPPAALNEAFAPMVYDSARGVTVFFGDRKSVV